MKPLVNLFNKKEKEEKEKSGSVSEKPNASTSASNTILSPKEFMESKYNTSTILVDGKPKTDVPSNKLSTPIQFKAKANEPVAPSIKVHTIDMNNFSEATSSDCEVWTVLDDGTLPSKTVVGYTVGRDVLIDAKEGCEYVIYNRATDTFYQYATDNKLKDLDTKLKDIDSQRNSLTTNFELNTGEVLKQFEEVSARIKAFIDAEDYEHITDADLKLYNELQAKLNDNISAYESTMNGLNLEYDNTLTNKHSYGMSAGEAAELKQLREQYDTLNKQYSKLVSTKDAPIEAVAGVKEELDAVRIRLTQLEQISAASNGMVYDSAEVLTSDLNKIARNNKTELNEYGKYIDEQLKNIVVADDTEQINSLADCIRRAINRKLNADADGSWTQDMRDYSRLVDSVVFKNTNTALSSNSSSLNIATWLLAGISDWSDLTQVLTKGITFQKVYKDITGSAYTTGSGRVVGTIQDVTIEGLDPARQEYWRSREDLTPYKRYLASYFGGDYAQLPSYSDMTTTYINKSTGEVQTAGKTNSKLVNGIVDFMFEILTDPTVYLGITKDVVKGIAKDTLIKNSADAFVDSVYDIARRSDLVLPEDVATKKLLRDNFIDVINNNAIKNIDEFAYAWNEAQQNSLVAMFKNTDIVQDIAKLTDNPKLYNEATKMLASAEAMQYVSKTYVQADKFITEMLADKSSDIVRAWKQSQLLVNTATTLDFTETVLNKLQLGGATVIFDTIKYTKDARAYLTAYTKYIKNEIKKDLLTVPAINTATQWIVKATTRLGSVANNIAEWTLDKMSKHKGALPLSELERQVKLLELHSASATVETIKEAAKTGADCTDAVLFIQRTTQEYKNDYGKFIVKSNTEQYRSLADYSTDALDKVAVASGFKDYAEHMQYIEATLRVVNNTYDGAVWDMYRDHLARIESNRIISTYATQTEYYTKAFTALNKKNLNVLSTFKFNYLNTEPDGAQLMDEFRKAIADLRDKSNVKKAREILTKEFESYSKSMFGVINLTPSMEAAPATAYARESATAVVAEYLSTKVGMPITEKDVTPFVSDVFQEVITPNKIDEANIVYNIMLSKGNGMRTYIGANVIDLATDITDATSQVRREIERLRFVADTLGDTKAARTLDAVLQDATAVIRAQEFVQGIDTSMASVEAKQLIVDAFAGQHKLLNLYSDAYASGDESVLDKALNKIIEASTAHGNAMDNKRLNLYPTKMITADTETNITHLIDTVNTIPELAESDEFVDVFIAPVAYRKGNDPFAITLTTRDGRKLQLCNGDVDLASLNDTTVQEQFRMSSAELAQMYSGYNKVNTEEYYGRLREYLENTIADARQHGKTVRMIGCNLDAVGTGQSTYLNRFMYYNDLPRAYTQYLDVTRYMKGSEKCYRFTDEEIVVLRQQLKDAFTSAKYTDATDVSFDPAHIFQDLEYITDSDTYHSDVLNRYIENIQTYGKNATSTMTGNTSKLGMYVNTTQLDKFISKQTGKDFHINVSNLVDYMEPTQHTYNAHTVINTDRVAEWMDVEYVTREAQYTPPLDEVKVEEAFKLTKRYEMYYGKLDRMRNVATEDEYKAVTSAVINIARETDIRGTLSPRINALTSLEFTDARKVTAVLLEAKDRLGITELQVRRELRKCNQNPNNTALLLIFNDDMCARRTLDNYSHRQYADRRGQVFIRDASTQVKTLKAQEKVLTDIGASKIASELNLLSVSTQGTYFNTLAQLRKLNGLTPKQDIAFKIKQTTYQEMEDLIRAVNLPVDAKHLNYNKVMEYRYKAIADSTDSVAKATAQTILNLDPESFDALLLGQGRNALIVDPSSKLFDDAGAVVQWLNDKKLNGYIVNDLTLPSGKNAFVVHKDLTKYTLNQSMYDRARYIQRNADITTQYNGVYNAFEEEINTIKSELNTAQQELAALLKIPYAKRDNDLVDVLKEDIDVYKRKIAELQSGAAVLDKLSAFDSRLMNESHSTYGYSAHRAPITNEWKEYIDSIVPAEHKIDGMFDGIAVDGTYITNMLCDLDDVANYTVVRSNIMNNMYTAMAYNFNRLDCNNDLVNLISNPENTLGRHMARMTGKDSVVMPTDEQIYDMLNDHGFKLVDISVEDVDKARGIQKYKVKDVTEKLKDPQYRYKNFAILPVHDKHARTLKNAFVVDNEVYYQLLNDVASNNAYAKYLQTPEHLADVMKAVNNVRSMYITGLLYTSTFLGTAFRNVIDSNIKAIAESKGDPNYYRHYVNAVEYNAKYEKFMIDVYNRVGNVSPNAIDKYFSSLAADEVPSLSRDEAIRLYTVFNAQASAGTPLQDIVAKANNTALMEALGNSLQLDQKTLDNVQDVFQQVTNAHWKDNTRYRQDNIYKYTAEIKDKLIKTGLDAENATVIANAYPKWHGQREALYSRLFNADTALGKVLSGINKNAFDNAELRARTALMMTQMDKGMSDVLANKSVIKTQFNYASKPDWLSIVDKWMPFTTYQYYNAKYWLDPSNYSALTLRTMTELSQYTASDKVNTVDSVSNQIKKDYLKTIMERESDEDTEENVTLEAIKQSLINDVNNYEGTHTGTGYINGIKISDDHYLKTGNGMFDTFEFVYQMCQAAVTAASGHIPDTVASKLLPPFNTLYNNSVKTPYDYVTAYAPLVPVLGVMINNTVSIAKSVHANLGAEVANYKLLTNEVANERLNSTLKYLRAIGFGLANSVIGTYSESTQSYYDRPVFKQYVDETGRTVAWWDLTDEEKKKYRYVIGVSYVPTSVIKPSDSASIYAVLMELGYDSDDAKAVMSQCWNTGAWVHNPMYYSVASDGKYYARTELLEQAIIDMAEHGYTAEEIIDVLTSTDKWWNPETHKAMTDAEIYSKYMSLAFSKLYRELPEYIRYDSKQYAALKQYYKALGYSTEEMWVAMANNRGYIDENGEYRVLTEEQVAEYNKTVRNDRFAVKSNDDFLQWYDTLPEYIKYEQGAYKRTLSFLTQFMPYEEANKRIEQGVYLTPDGRLINCSGLTNPNAPWQDAEGYWHKAGDNINLGYKSFEEYYKTLPEFLQYTKGAFKTTNEALKKLGLSYNERLKAMQDGAYAMLIDPNTLTGATDKDVWLGKEVVLDNGKYVIVDCSNMTPAGTRHRDYVPRPKISGITRKGTRWNASRINSTGKYKPVRAPYFKRVGISGNYKVNMYAGASYGVRKMYTVKLGRNPVRQSLSLKSCYPASYRNVVYSNRRNMYKDMYAKYGASRMQMRANAQHMYSNASVIKLRRNEIQNRVRYGNRRSSF